MNTQPFDVEIGMPVRDAAGQEVGTVVEVVGFGSTRVSGSSGAKVTKAGSDTGYLKVRRRGSPDTDAQNLVIPFRSIAEISPEHLVILLCADDRRTALRPVDMPARDRPQTEGWRRRHLPWIGRGT